CRTRNRAAASLSRAPDSGEAAGEWMSRNRFLSRRSRGGLFPFPLRPSPAARPPPPPRRRRVGPRPARDERLERHLALLLAGGRQDDAPPVLVRLLLDHAVADHVEAERRERRLHLDVDRLERGVEHLVRHPRL